MSVSIVKVAARTPLGLNARQTGFLVRAGFPAMSEAPLSDATGKAITMAFVPTIDSRLVGPERLVMLAAPALEEVASIAWDGKVGVKIALDEGYVDAPLVSRLLDAMVKRILPSAFVEVAPRGEAALGALLPEAVGALEARQVDVVVLGGVHSDYDPRAIAALESSGRLFSSDNLDSRIPGEAAGFVVLIRDEYAARKALSPIARILGAGIGKERATPANDAPAHEAQGATAALEKATKPLLDAGQTAGWLLTDLTFEMHRMREWQSAFARFQDVLGRPYVIESPAQRMGYLGAAAMPVLAGLSATAWEHGYGPSETAIVMAGNDGGDRAAMVLSSARRGAKVEARA
jgi:3-oxoacyl-[acyl-carrier-protein] synthase-1